MYFHHTKNTNNSNIYINIIQQRRISNVEEAVNSAHNRYAGTEDVVLDVEPRISARDKDRDRSASSSVGGGGARERAVTDVPSRNGAY